MAVKNAANDRFVQLKVRRLISHRAAQLQDLALNNASNEICGDSRLAQTFFG